MVIAEGTAVAIGDASQVQALVDLIAPFIQQLSILVGGIFGVYIIFTLFRIYVEHKRTKILEDIRYNLDQLNIHYGVSCSRHRPGFFRRMSRWLRDQFTKKNKDWERDEL